MKKVMVIGCCGAGKSVFSKKLHTITGLPLVHLDQCYWQPGWVSTPTPLWHEKVDQLVKEERWIIDGNYSGTMGIRMKHADTIILLNTPRWKCLYRILKRALFGWGRVRSDMAEGCPEKMDINFIRFVFNFHRTHMPVIKAEMAKAEGKKYVLTNSSEISAFLKCATVRDRHNSLNSLLI